ncbi:MAG: glutamate--cysteine ligase [Candidatus Binatia bacterium]|nr:MAG: glutamate--cysteine ligase [Candidatus Binatia bacterium]
MSQYLRDAELEVPVETPRQLVDYFVRGGRPPEDWRVGTEYEKICVRRDGRAVPFFGPAGVEELLVRLSRSHGWEPVVENAHVVALRRGRASITLEPGAQLELSGEPWRTVREAARELRGHVREIVEVGEPLGIFFLGLGMQPFSPIDEIPWVPKERYRIMAPYMTKVGSLGHRMMKQTASIQVNVDYEDEADAMAKMRVATAICPLLTAMFANSPFCDGKLGEYLSYRSHVWTDTDPQRSGFLPFVFSDTASFDDYVRYALDVPMYFIVRERWIDMTAYTFRQYLERGYEGHRATLADWHAHLTTLFPEVRLKRYVEVRCFDCQMPELALAAPAICKGVLYSRGSLEAAWELVKAWTWEERLELWHEVHRSAMRAKVRGLTVRDLCGELLEAARLGLVDRGAQEEVVYLEPLFDLVRKGVSPAEEVRRRWSSEWAEDPEQLVRALAYRPF